MKLLREITQSLAHLFFPHTCAGCGSDILSSKQLICLHCLRGLPRTGFEHLADNPVEKIFWGRLPLQAASSHLYFSKSSRLQAILHQLKYKGRRDLGILLGKLMGEALQNAARFNTVEAIVPLPLHPSKERKRGYNQAALLSDGISSMLNKPVINNLLIRTRSTESQTHKGREARWQNMQGKFKCNIPAAPAYKHILLVDDVITTGASLEAAGAALLNIPGLQISIASLAYTST